MHILRGRGKKVNILGKAGIARRGHMWNNQVT
jgi:hypothetical protein